MQNKSTVGSVCGFGANMLLMYFRSRYGFRLEVSGFRFNLSSPFEHAGQAVATTNIGLKACMGTGGIYMNYNQCFPYVYCTWVDMREYIGDYTICPPFIMTRRTFDSGCGFACKLVRHCRVIASSLISA